MSFKEFSYLLQGISGESPLGRIVAIRAENDPEVVRQMTAEQKRIRTEYRRKMAMKKPQKEVANVMDQFKQAFIQLAK